MRASFHFLIQNFQLGVGEIEERAGDVLAGVIDNVRDSPAPIFAENGKTEAVVIQNGWLARLHGRRAMPEVACPLRHRPRIEIRSICEIPHP